MATATPRGGMRAKSIGHYTLGKTIGEGTFGKVKLGMHVLTGEKVAVKILEKERIVDVADVERVAREIKILKLVQHPHVIQLYEIIETPRQLYLIMEFCNGGELFDHIVQSGRVPEPEACRFFHQILGGVEQIHRCGVVHRDLKPENLLLDHQQNIKIVDFGLSNTFQDGQLLKTACGSPCYAAPEMIAGKRYVPSLCDVWSCGVILFAMVCGYLPFEDQNTAALYDKILSADYTPPKFISDSVRDLIARMLTTEPDFRITIPRIRQHSWYRQISEASRPYLPPDKGEVNLDQAILEQMDRLEFPRNYTSKCLQMRKHNHATATYYLLQERKNRTGECFVKVRRDEADVPAPSPREIAERTAFEAFDAAPTPADADRAAGIATAESENAREATWPAPAQDGCSERAPPMTPRTARNSATPTPARAPGPASARPRPSSQVRNYEQYYQVRADLPASSRQTPREPRHSAAATVASAARAAERQREASGSRTGAPRRHSEAPRGAATPDSARPPWGRGTPVQITPRAVGQTPRSSRPAGSGAAAVAAQRAQTPGRETPSEHGRTPPMSARRQAGGEPHSSRPSTSQSTHSPAPPAVPLTARGPGPFDGVRRRQFAGSAQPVSRRSPTAGYAAAAAVAADLYGEQDSSVSGSFTARSSAAGTTPADAWGASTRGISASPEACEASACGGAAPVREARDEVMRTCRGAFNVACTSSKAPNQIVQEIQRALGLQRVAFKQASPFLVKCQKHGLRFEMEVAHLDHLESIYVVRFRRVAGELAAYRDLCSKVVADMKI